MRARVGRVTWCSFVLVLAAGCGGAPGGGSVAVGAGPGSVVSSSTTTAVTVSIPATAAEAVGSIAAGLAERGQDPASAGCVAQRLDAEYSGGELKFAIVLLSTPHPSDAQVAASVEATGLGTVPGDLPERVFLTVQECVGVTGSSSTVTTAGSSPPSSSVVSPGAPR